jgi:hypothetical protein
MQRARWVRAPSLSRTRSNHRQVIGAVVVFWPDWWLVKSSAWESAGFDHDRRTAADPAWIEFLSCKVDPFDWFFEGRRSATKEIVLYKYREEIPNRGQTKTRALILLCRLWGPSENKGTESGTASWVQRCIKNRAHIFPVGPKFKNLSIDG